MQRARRLASIAAVTVVGLLAIAGCRANADVAAYAGKETYTEDRITAIYDDTFKKFAAGPRPQAADPSAAPGASPSAPTPAEPKRSDMPLTRQDIVVALVGRDMLKAIAEKSGIKPLTVPPQQLQESKPLPLDSEYMKIWAEHEGYHFALLQSLPRKTPTDADLRGIYDTLDKGGGLQSGTSFTQFATSLDETQQQTVAALVATRDALAAQVRDGDVVVNPRYTPAELVVFSFPDAQGGEHPLIVVPLETDPGEPYVRDAS